MKVICVNTGSLKNRFGISHCTPELIEGKEYSVSCSEYSTSYSVKGHLYDPCIGQTVAYRKERFIPLSTIDEIELAEQRAMQPPNPLPIKSK